MTQRGKFSRCEGIPSKKRLYLHAALGRLAIRAPGDFKVLEPADECDGLADPNGLEG